MECISSSSASVLVNGSPLGEFRLEHGLRQGDLLSPFLFLIVAEGLSIMMIKATSLGFFEAAKIDQDNVEVSHLQFTDDTILMGAAGVENAWKMKLFLKIWSSFRAL